MELILNNIRLVTFAPNENRIRIKSILKTFVVLLFLTYM